MLRAVTYCRCSTEEEGQRDALIRQAAEARECICRLNWLLVEEYIESRSGTSTQGRVQYQRLFADLSTDKFDVVVIKSQDRLMRNTRDWYIFADQLMNCGKKLYFYLENRFYSRDDALITGIKAILAEEYSRELSKKINNAHKSRQKTGSALMLTSNTYGYRKMPDKTLEIIEEEAAVKRQMYKLCADGYGSRRIARILQDEGVRKRNGSFFSDSDIRRMIRNPMNKGTVVMNRKHYDFDTRQVTKVAEENQYVYENRIPAIDSSPLWAKANQEIDRRCSCKKTSNCAFCGKNTGKYPLSGKIICGICGAPFYRTVRSNKKGKLHERKCRTYLEDGRCSFTNNLSENAIRPFAVGRKNWLFSSSVDGANASAVVYTMVEMAKAHGLNIYGYLKFLLENRPSKNMTDEQLAELAPWSEKLQSIKNRM